MKSPPAGQEGMLCWLAFRARWGSTAAGESLRVARHMIVRLFTRFFCVSMVFS